MKAFTLIEVLVALAIVAILSAISYMTFREVIQGGRDSKRQADLATLQSYLEQYRADQGFYPVTAGATGMNTLLTSGTGPFTNCIGNITPCTVSKTYINQIPKDPFHSNRKYCYNSTDSNDAVCDNFATKCTKYSLYSDLEKNSVNLTCGGSSTYDLKVGPP